MEETSDDKQKEQLDKYKVAVQLLLYEGDMAWKILSAFTVVHILLVGFIGSMISKSGIVFFQSNWPCFIASFFGLLLIIPWWGTFKRNTKYYFFRMAQAKHCELNEWDLLKKDGEKFAEGERVIIDGKPHQMGWLSHNMKNKFAVEWLMGCFALLYILLLITFWPFHYVC